MKGQKAFSLIELSIVILIIGILIAGVTQSSVLIKKARLSNARTITQNSPITSIKNLTMWLETTLEKSFDKTQLESNDTIETWKDINPQSITKYNATQSSVGNRPDYLEDVINHLPVLRFNGSSDNMFFDGNILVNSNYTIFIVGQRRSANSSHSPLIGGSSTSDYQNLHISYRNNTSFTMAHYGAGTNLDVAVSAYSSPTPTIFSLLFSQSDGKKIWLNSGSSPDASSSDASQKIALSGYPNSKIGQYFTNYFNGDIAEIIIFNRSLKDEERNSVESYLSKKYNINLD